MSFANPTRLRLGMRANFEGKDYQLVGRSVLGEMEDGETYYWNEFNLETDTGEEATLVYDETERSSQWRLITLFDPEYPMTAADAATKSVGDHLNLTGDDVRVSFRGSSHVYYFEGKAPEGEEVGKAAEYFNAVSGSIMQVVSWTGDEVEFYNGVNLTSGMVNSAFGLAQDWTGELVSQLSSRSDSDSGNYLSGFKFALIAAFVLVMFVVIFGRSFSCSRDYEAGPIKPTPAGSPPLAMGAIGTLFDKQYRITAHAVVETDEVGFKCEHHEYALADNNGGTALLVCGDQPGAADWIFFEPLSPMVAPTAKEAAAKQVGEQVELDGFTGKVTEIFLSTIEQTESGEGELKPGIVTYGFRCKNEYFTLLGRWNNAGIQYFRGRVVPAKKAAAAFSAAK